jgi:hypothetical protein
VVLPATVRDKRHQRRTRLLGGDWCSVVVEAL